MHDPLTRMFARSYAMLALGTVSAAAGFLLVFVLAETHPICGLTALAVGMSGYAFGSVMASQPARKARLRIAFGKLTRKQRRSRH